MQNVTTFLAHALIAQVAEHGYRRIRVAPYAALSERERSLLLALALDLETSGVGNLAPVALTLGDLSKRSFVKLDTAAPSTLRISMTLVGYAVAVAEARAVVALEERAMVHVALAG